MGKKLAADTLDLTKELKSARADDEERVELPGFEWSKLIGDLVIPAAVIEQALWNADVTEPEHVFTKPNEVNGAFLTVLRGAIGDLKIKVRSRE